MRTEFNAKAQSRQDAIGFFYYETRKPGIIEKISWFPGFLMELFLVAPLRLGVFALKVFCLVAVCRVWPAFLPTPFAHSRQHMAGQPVRHLGVQHHKCLFRHRQIFRHRHRADELREAEHHQM